MPDQAQVFTGDQIVVVQAMTIRSAIRLYARTGMQANRAYTPKNMRLTCEKITGKAFKSRDYAGMIQALTDFIGH